MDEVEEMMEALALDESSVYEYVRDWNYEFDACQFFDFTVAETDYDVRRAHQWFGYCAQYPPAPYRMKVNLENILNNRPTCSPELDDVETVSPSIVTPSDRGMPSSGEKTEAGSYLKYHRLFVDSPTIRVKRKFSNRSSKSSKTYMKPTASHLAKQIKAVDIHAGRMLEDPKRQKLEIGFLRKVSQLKHLTSFSHKTTTKDAESEASSNSKSKTTIPQKPRFQTEERARRRRPQSKAEPSTHNFKALPLNRKILDSPSVPMRKKSMTDLLMFQVFNQGLCELQG